MDLYVNTSTGSVISSQEMIAANPNTIFPIPFEPVDGYAPLEETAPSYDEETQKLSYSTTASVVNGKWTRTITVVDLSPEELAERKKARVPASVTRRQGRLALLEVGKLADVEAAIANIEDATSRTAAQIEYEADTWERSSAFLQGMWAQLGGTDDELDDLFNLAATK